MTHTPGPWVENPLEDCEWSLDTGGGNYFSFIGPAGQEPIAVSVVSDSFGRDEEMDANTKLIAAAPDLLEALDGFPIRENENDADYITLILGWWITSGSKALAKAEGRS